VTHASLHLRPTQSFYTRMSPLPANRIQDRVGTGFGTPSGPGLDLVGTPKGPPFSAAAIAHRHNGKPLTSIRPLELDVFRTNHCPLPHPAPAFCLPVIS
jgi:hypothetical protein